jgi:hypothetical protein
MSKKPIVVACPSDLHCGHLVGLTPPDWQGSVDHASRDARKKMAYIQNEGWRLYTDAIKKHKPDIAIWNGDLVDGDGHRSGGCEQISTDPKEQKDMAEDCVKAMKAEENYFVRGTPYHTGDSEQHEDAIAKMFSAKAHDHPQISIGSFTFDCKHKIGSSSVPYGRNTQLSKEITWNMEWAQYKGMELADVFVRSHVHYHRHIEQTRGPKMIHAITTPALQWRGTRYGKQQCSGTVDFGIAFFYVYPDHVELKTELMEIDQGFSPLITSNIKR